MEFSQWCYGVIGVSRLELGHLPMTFFTGSVDGRRRTEVFPVHLPCLIWRGDCACPGRCQDIGTFCGWKDWCFILKVTEAYKIYPVDFPHVRKDLFTWALWKPHGLIIIWGGRFLVLDLAGDPVFLQYLENSNCRMGAGWRMSCRPWASEFCLAIHFSFSWDWP